MMRGKIANMCEEEDCDCKGFKLKGPQAKKVSDSQINCKLMLSLNLQS